MRKRGRERGLVIERKGEKEGEIANKVSEKRERKKARYKVSLKNRKSDGNRAWERSTLNLGNKIKRMGAGRIC